MFPFAWSNKAKPKINVYEKSIYFTPQKDELKF